MLSSSDILPAVPKSGFWKIRPMEAARLCSASFVMSLSVVLPFESGIERRIFPFDGDKVPAIILYRVDFPAPLEPITVIKSP